MITKKDFESWLNRRLAQGMKINGYHSTYYLTHVNLRTNNIRNILGTLMRRHNKELFNKLYQKLGKTAEHELR